MKLIELDELPACVEGGFVRQYLGVLVLVAGTAFAAHAQVTIINDTFEPAAPGAIIGSVNPINVAGYSVSIVPGAGAGGTAGLQLQFTNDGSGGEFSGLAVPYINQIVSGNTSMNPSDYTLSFDAESTSGYLDIAISTWDGQYSSGSFDGVLQDNYVPLTNSFQHFSINLGTMEGTLSGLGVAGGTYEFLFQLYTSEPSPYTDTGVIDSLQLTMVPEPSPVALFGLGLWVLRIGYWPKRLRARERSQAVQRARRPTTGFSPAISQVS